MREVSVYLISVTVNSDCTMEQQWQVQRSFPRSITHKRRAERPDPELARETPESHTRTHTHTRWSPASRHGPSKHTEGEKHPCDRQCRIFPSAIKHWLFF